MNSSEKKILIVEDNEDCRELQVATAQLKAHPSTRDILVVICTAFDAGPYVKLALDAGAAEIVHKPVKLSDLGNLFQRYVPSEKNDAPAGASMRNTSKCESLSI